MDPYMGIFAKLEMVALKSAYLTMYSRLLTDAIAFGVIGVLFTLSFYFFFYRGVWKQNLKGERDIFVFLSIASFGLLGAPLFFIGMDLISPFNWAVLNNPELLIAQKLIGL